MSNQKNALARKFTTFSLLRFAMPTILMMVFMVLLHMGMTGAAIATGIGYSIATIAGIVVFSKRKGTLHFVKPLIKLKEWGQSCYSNRTVYRAQNARYFCMRMGKMALTRH